MTLTFVPKIVVVVVVCLLMGGWMLSVAIELAKHMFEVAAAL
jgi:flagellar biosynthetic protein FliQ